MQAVIIPSFGNADVLTIAERSVPECAQGQLLIKVAASGVNRADVMQRQGKYPAPTEAPPDIAGLEVSGIVAALHPSCVRYRVGDRVMALLSGGGYAEYAVALEECCLPVPDHITLRDAAALPESLFTVWANLFIAAQVKPCELVLVHGGTSGIGSMAIQMLRAHGAVPIVTAAGAEKTAWCIQSGAALAIDYQAQDFVTVIADRTQGRGVDVILDMVGGDYLPRNLACLAPQGRLVSISTLQGTKGELDIRAMMRQRAVITGTTLRGRSACEKARLAHAVERQVLPWVTQGRVKPLISHYFSLNNAAAAHKTLESGASRGKVVLEVGV